MRRSILFALVATVLAAVAAVAMAAGSSSPQPALGAWGAGAHSGAAATEAMPAGMRRLVVFTRTVREFYVDVGAAGESPGDSFLFEQRVLNRARTHVIGRDSVECTIRIRSFACNGTLLLRRGSITIDGATFGPNRFAVTGGTGRFAGVGGELHVIDVARNLSRLEFWLKR